MVTVDPDKACPHLNFDAEVEVNCLGVGETSDGTPKAYSASIRVRCADCEELFRWIGVQAGMQPNRPMVSVDETQLHAPLRPSSSDPDFGLGIPGFAIQMTGPS